MTTLEMISEIQGPDRHPQTDALRVLAPSAALTSRDDDNVAIVLSDGRRIEPFDGIVTLLSADATLVSSATNHDLKHLDQYLLSRTFLKGNSLSVTDRLVLGLLHSYMTSLSDTELYQYICLARWFDHIQSIVPVLSHVPIKTNTDTRSVKDDKKGKKGSNNTSTQANSSSSSASNSSSTINDAAALDIRVGRIVHIEGHPTDPGLYVEQIDLGESTGPRQIVSGLAKFISQSDLLDRYVCVLVNIASSEIKGVKSSGLVLCSSNSDHTIVEPIRPADGVAAGERIMFPGVPTVQDGLIDSLKPKRLHKLLKLLKTSDDEIPFAMCGNLPFMTGRGRVYSSSSLRNCHIK